MRYTCCSYCDIVLSCWIIRASSQANYLKLYDAKPSNVRCIAAATKNYTVPEKYADVSAKSRDQYYACTYTPLA